MQSTVKSRPSAEVLKILYQFELPTELCGMLIGKQGNFVKSIIGNSGALINIDDHPYLSHVKICSVEGKLTFITRKMMA